MFRHISNMLGEIKIEPNESLFEFPIRVLSCEMNADQLRLWHEKHRFYEKINQNVKIIVVVYVYLFNVYFLFVCIFIFISVLSFSF